MTKKTVQLIPNVSNVHIGSGSDSEKTNIQFDSQLWPDKICMHVISGKWEIDKVDGSLVTLVNHDEVISE